MPTMYAVASAKGGVGKTTTTANLAAALAAAGHTTVAVDGDLGAPNLAPALGVDVPEGGTTLHDVLAGDADPVEATYEGPHGLAVVPGGRTLEAFRAADPARLTEVVTAITGAEYVVVDTGGGVTHESALPLSIADGVVLVSTPTRDALADTARTLELADRLGGTVAGLVLTRAGAADRDADPVSLDVPLLGRVTEDAVVPAAAAAGEPLSAFAPESDPAADYRAVVAALTDTPVAGPSDPDPSPGVEATDADRPAADTADPPTPRPLDGEESRTTTPLDASDGSARTEAVDADDATDAGPDPADASGDAPTPRPLDDDAEPAITPLADPVTAVSPDPMDGDADAVDAPRTVLGEVVDGPVAAVDGEVADPGDGGGDRSGGFFGRLLR